MTRSAATVPGVLRIEVAGFELFGHEHVVAPDAPRAVVLHDEGDDLDSVRGLRRALVGQGITVYEWDLPGHGLSGGSYARDTAAATTAMARAVDPEGTLGVSYVGIGRTVGHLLDTEVAHPVSITAIQPRGLPDPFPSPLWRRVPTLCLVDPADSMAEKVADTIAQAARTWCVRAFVHGYTDAAGSGHWQRHAGSMTGQLIREQTWWWRRRQDRRNAPLNPGGGDA